MSRARRQVLAVGSISVGVLVAATGHAASLQKVDNWGASGVPSYVNMYIYVPDDPVTNPPIVVASHYCTGTASAYFNQISATVRAADEHGFIIIFPEATGRNCWDVGSDGVAHPRWRRRHAGHRTDGGVRALRVLRGCRRGFTSWVGRPVR